MEKENNSKIQELEEKLDAVGTGFLKQQKDIKKLKKRQPRKMTAMKFVGVVFDPEKYKAGEAEINEALSNGFEVIRDFETGGGIVMALGKWERKDEKVKNGWTK
jgi:predicted  nucleic acid-binding Zn-ribbon protein